jgi:hypothetical protein
MDRGRLYTRRRKLTSAGKRLDGHLHRFGHVLERDVPVSRRGIQIIIIIIVIIIDAAV